MAAERLEQDQFSLGKRTGLNQTVIDHLPGIFYVVGPDGCMERWNSRFETLSGYSEAELEGRPAASFFTGSDRDNIEQAIETVFATGSATVEAQFTTQDGAEVPMLLTGVRSAIQGQTRLVGMGIDISERKQRERQLQAAKEDAERARREAEAARRDAERQRRRAEDANRSKSRFLAGVAHDLKSPVTGIEGFANVLANTLSGQPVEHARSIRRSVQHISDMAHSLTELAQLGTESIERGTAPTEVGALLKTLATDFAPRVEETGVAMHVDLPASDPSASGSSASDPSPSEESSPEGDASGEWGAVWADTHELSLRRALTNLIENAITYSNAGDTVTLRAAQHVPDANGTLSLGAGQHRVEGRGAADAAACDAWVAITVEDTGPGIDPAFMTRLFEPFARNVSDTEGTGLGLAITKELVETMGGEIRAESEKGNGTRFHVLLPASGTPV
jgi:PAS domain S-box-containing protein